MHIFINKKYLTYDNYKVKCAVGKRGIGKKQKEGDQITPKGIFSVKKILYRKDKVKRLRSKIKKMQIEKNMGWCDDPLNKKKYNKLISIKRKIKCEKLHRKDHKYDLFIPIKYNYSKPIKFRGSCIFIHLTNNYKPTAGCIAIQKKDFLIMLRLINKKTKIQIN